MVAGGVEDYRPEPPESGKRKKRDDSKEDPGECGVDSMEKRQIRR